MMDNFLLEAEILFQKNFPLASLSTMRAGGTCQYFVMPDTIDKLQNLLVFLKNSGKPFQVVGRLSNILFRDGLIETVIISITKLRNHEFDEHGLYRVECGAGLPEVARNLTNAGFIGFSGLAGVPASLGGAIFMNASCYGQAISDYLVRVTCVKDNGEIIQFQKSELGFSWRHSAFHGLLKGMVIVEAYFELRPGDTAEIGAHMQASANDRRLFQEHRYPNLGSTFATCDIYGLFAARFPLYRVGFWLIRLWVRLHAVKRDTLWPRLINRYSQYFFRIRETEKVGFSECTFNCIVNKGNACASELIAFIRNVQNRTKNCIPLEIEIFENIA